MWCLKRFTLAILLCSLLGMMTIHGGAQDTCSVLCDACQECEEAAEYNCDGLYGAEYLSCIEAHGCESVCQECDDCTSGGDVESPPGEGTPSDSMSPEGESAQKPGDSDQDGMPNAKDACPTVAGPPALQGCPPTVGGENTPSESPSPSLPEPVCVAVDQTLFEDDFEDANARGWTLESGWQVVQQGGNYVLHGQNHQWVSLDSGAQWSDYTLRLNLKLVSGTIHLNYHLSDAGRYFIGISQHGLYLSKEAPWKTFKDLSSALTNLSLNAWHALEIAGRDGQISLSIDGVKRLSYLDETPLQSGSIAFETLDASEAFIDDVVVFNEGTGEVVCSEQDEVDPSDRAYVVGELLVRFKPELSISEIQAAVQAMGTEIVDGFLAFGIYHLKVISGEDTLVVLQRCQAHASVETCELNGLWSLFDAPNDPGFPMQWPLMSWVTTNAFDIGIQRAWKAGFTDSSAVTVAVIDSGVDTEHPDLRANLLDSGYDVVHGDALPDDRIGHGTFVASIIGAVGNNGTSLTGVSWEASILPLKAADNLSTIDRAIHNLGALIGTRSFSAMSWADFVGALERVIQLKKSGTNIRVINLSAGGGASDLLEGAIFQVLDQDILLVTAAGNQERGADVEVSPIYPCSYSHQNILCVAAIDINGRLSAFSNYGVNSVDLAAPGEGIIGLMAREISGSGTMLESETTTTVSVSSKLACELMVKSQGTSFATAHTSGVAALLTAVCPSYSASDIKQLILSNVRDSTSLEGKVQSGGFLQWPQTLPAACGANAGL